MILCLDLKLGMIDKIVFKMKYLLCVVLLLQIIIELQSIYNFCLFFISPLKFKGIEIREPIIEGFSYYFQ